MSTGLRIWPFHVRYEQAFAELNYAWIRRYFEVEAEDRKALDNPRAYALDGGGQIFFACLDADVVGTAAMVAKGGGVFELAKMAVREDCQGRGISRHLMSRCITFARASSARAVFLLTHDSLKPALHLYESSGFVRRSAVEDQRYARSNVEMWLRLDTPGAC